MVQLLNQRSDELAPFTILLCRDAIYMMAPHVDSNFGRIHTLGFKAKHTKLSVCVFEAQQLNQRR